MLSLGRLLEEWVTRHLRDFVKPGMHVMDIGANMGFYTLMLCDLVGPEGHVTAFEPWPNFFEILRRNVELNGFQKRCTLVQKAVHAHAGQQPFSFYQNYGTGGCTEATREYLDTQGIATDASLEHAEFQVETICLDEYYSEDMPPIDFFKMDIEGCEPFVFQGATSLLGRSHQVSIFCEFCPQMLRSFGVDPLAFLEDLQAKGFRIADITPQGIQEVRSLSATVDAITDDGWKELLLVKSNGEQTESANAPIA